VGKHENGRPLDPTNTLSPAGERVIIDEVGGAVGAPPALNDLSDVDPATQPAKGSLLVGNGSLWVEQPVGLDGQVLIADAAQPNGVRWAPGPSGSGVGTLIFGADSVGATTTTRYLYAGHAEGLAEVAPHFYVMPRAGTLKNLFVRHDDPAGNGGLIVYRVRRNTTATLLLVSLASTGLGSSNLINTVPVLAGDLIDLQVVKVVGVGAPPRNVKATMEVA